MPNLPELHALITQSNASSKGIKTSLWLLILQLKALLLLEQISYGSGFMVLEATLHFTGFALISW
jgi:hypothetical protein